MATSYEATAKKWYDKGLWSVDNLRQLVEAGKISADAFERITGEPHDA